MVALDIRVGRTYTSTCHEAFLADTFLNYLKYSPDEDGTRSSAIEAIISLLRSSCPRDTRALAAALVSNVQRGSSMLWVEAYPIYQLMGCRQQGGHQEPEPDVEMDVAKLSEAIQLQFNKEFANLKAAKEAGE